jgi:response regulator RpfG family c-di-GMP phosphodiesterase
MTTRQILFVDDDTNILQGYQRQLRNAYAVTIAAGGRQGLEAIAKTGPFAVVVADMRMPEMDGVQFLARVKEQSPDTVRIMLTGNADQGTASEAVNQGHIFRFLNKPCPPDVITRTLDAALEQHRLITAEKELLSKTLSGSISLLSELLSLVNPIAFGRAGRIRRLAKHLCERLAPVNAWEIELAAMLSQVGCIGVPEKTLTALYQGGTVPEKDWNAFQAHPQSGRDLVGRIPRLEGVAQIIGYQGKRFDGTGLPADGVAGRQIPLGGRILKLLLDYDTLISSHMVKEEAIAVLQSRAGWYDPKLIDALSQIQDIRFIARDVTIGELTESMVLDEHIVSTSGEILVARGQQVTTAMRERLKSFAKSFRSVREPIRVLCPVERVDATADATRAGARQTSIA